MFNVTDLGMLSSSQSAVKFKSLTGAIHEQCTAPTIPELSLPFVHSGGGVEMVWLQVTRIIVSKMMEFLTPGGASYFLVHSTSVKL